MSERSEVRADIREDFIKRLFAVAISVGFAATFTGMNWVKNQQLPTEPERGEIFLLLTALIATVVSWDGYLVSIKEKRLYGTWRFTIDIALVFLYMVLLITAKNLELFRWLLAFIFGVYVAWDFLSAQEHYDKYNLKSGASQTGSALRALELYWLGLLDAPEIKRGPIITLSWACYFLALPCLGEWAEPLGPYTFSAFATAGLIAYRHDKVRKGVDVGGITGFRMRARLALIAALLILLIVLGSFKLSHW